MSIIGRVIMSRSLTIGTWMERARQRRALRALSDTMLKDIGISRADVWREARKSIWQA